MSPDEFKAATAWMYRDEPRPKEDAVAAAGTVEELVTALLDCLRDYDPHGAFGPEPDWQFVERHLHRLVDLARK